MAGRQDAGRGHGFAGSDAGPAAGPPAGAAAGPSARRPGARLRRLRPEEWLFAALGLVLAVLVVRTGYGYRAVAQVLISPGLLGAVLVGCVLVFLTTYRRAPMTGPWPDRPRLRIAGREVAAALRLFLPLFACLVSYAALHDLTPVVRPRVVDDWLIAADHALVGVDASRWLDDRIGSAAMTVVMVVCYLSYGSAQAVYATVQYGRGRVWAYRDFSLAVTITGVVGYAGYLLVPGVGPHIYQAALFPDRLPGHSGPLGSVLDSISGVQGTARDVFPSLHTAMTVALLGCMWRDARKMFWCYLPLGLGLVLSTVYLRKHYVVDVLAGVLLALLAVGLAGRINRWWYLPGGLTATGVITAADPAGATAGPAGITAGRGTAAGPAGVAAGRAGATADPAGATADRAGIAAGPAPRRRPG